MSVRDIIQAAAGAVGGEYQISRSLRFNSADSAYLNRTPASAGNRKTWTWSGWVKRSSLGGETIFAAGTGSVSNRAAIDFDSGQFRVIFGDGANVIPTTPVFRDPSAWYHFVVAIDTTQATDSNRVKIYVNGSQITALSSPTYPAQNYDTFVNATNQHVLGARFRTSVDGYFNGYLTDVYLIDGQALTPSSFGEINADTGVWSPIEYTGTYGTNGFYLNFSDNSSTSALGTDFSGNSNTWTTNNFSVTAGAGNDSLVDSPTRYGTDTGAGGTVRGNYCTWNPLNKNITTTSDGNLLAAHVNNSQAGIAGTIAVKTGKWYWEVVPNSTNGFAGGVTPEAYTGSSNIVTGPTGAVFYYGDGQKYVSGSNSSYGATYTGNDVIGIALDMDAGEVTFYKNNVSQGAITLPLSTGYFPACASGTGGSTITHIANFGQRPFAYTAPSGFKALVTTNLPDPTIVEGDDYFNTVLYTGTGSARSVTGVGFQPDWVWIKERNAAADHGLYDAVRGVQNQLESNTTTDETTESTGLTAFGTNGFTVGSLAQLNTNNDTYVAWNWKANGAGSSNTAGTITSTVSANTTSGISIVTYSGTGTAGTVGHGIGIAPSMVIVKVRSGPSAQNWRVLHTSLNITGGAFLTLNSTAAAEIDSNIFNNTLPTSTVFSVGNGNSSNNSGYTYVAYCFAPVAGYSAFGSYTGNQSSDGPFIYTGFRPAWVMIKAVTAVLSGFDSWRSWYIVNNAMYPNNSTVENQLWANLNVAENLRGDGSTAGNLGIDLLSNGFKIVRPSSYPVEINYGGATMIYAAFAENPFKLSLAR